MTTQVKRFSDSGPRDHLCVLRQDDGDICLEIYCNGPGMLNTGFIGTEFCLPGVGGGQSPETVKALRNLIAAMEKDNQDHPQNRGKDEPFTDRKADRIEELKAEVERLKGEEFKLTGVVLEMQKMIDIQEERAEAAEAHLAALMDAIRNAREAQGRFGTSGHYVLTCLEKALSNLPAAAKELVEKLAERDQLIERQVELVNSERAIMNEALVLRAGLKEIEKEAGDLGE